MKRLDKFSVSLFKSYKGSKSYSHLTTNMYEEIINNLDSPSSAYYMAKMMSEHPKIYDTVEVRLGPRTVGEDCRSYEIRFLKACVNHVWYQSNINKINESINDFNTLINFQKPTENDGITASVGGDL